MEQLTFWSEEHLASLFQPPDLGEVLMTHAGISCSCSELLWIISGLNGCSGKTSPACCRATKDGILEPFSGCWRNSGMGSPIGFLTLNTGESHSGAEESSLSDILETGDHLRGRSLTPRACQGVLSRAERIGRTLPAALLEVLKAKAGL